jgi:uncharacterized membrane protein (TIGR02234 family)
VSPETSQRREFSLVLALGAVGAGLILLAVRQPWAHARYTPPHPFPAQDIAVTGQNLVPLAAALAIAALACLAAVIATKGLFRRVAGVLLAAIGAAAVTAGIATVTSAAVLAAAASAASGSFTSAGGSTISGSGTSSGASGLIGGAAGHASIAVLPWQAAAVAGALAIALAGLAVAWRGARWPGMSAKYNRAGQPPPTDPADSATMWESLTRDVDPTA